MAQAACVVFSSRDLSKIMAPAKAMKAKKVAMKAMKGQKAMSKGALLGELVNATELKKSDKFTLPGLCMIKTRKKAATKAGKRMMFGKEVIVKARPAKTVVKAFPVAALKQQI